MAFACVKGFLSSGALTPDAIKVYDVRPEAYSNYIMLGVEACGSAAEAVEFADYVVLAVKPQQLDTALSSLGECEDFSGKVFVSFAAGVSTGSICRSLERDVAVIRTMPNTPFLIGKGTMAVSRNSAVEKGDFEAVCSLFSCIANVVVLDENMMNDVIALNGSSPAYVFRFFLAMYDAALKSGFTASQARELILSTFEGAVAMLRRFDDPVQLLKNVTSPNGTTQASLESLDADDFEGVISRCMAACTRRARELSEQY